MFLVNDFKVHCVYTEILHCDGL